MDQIKLKQPQGNIKANFKRILPSDPRYAAMSAAERFRNDKLPMFEGTLSTPEKPEELFEYATWDYKDNNGKILFLAGSIRPLSTRAGVQDHLTAPEFTREQMESVDPATGEITANGFTMNPHTIFVRYNKAKVLKDSDLYTALTPAELAINENRPTFWLKAQLAKGTKELRGSLWDRSGRYGPYLSGNTQYPMTKAEVEALKNGADQSIGFEQHEEAAPRTGRRARAKDQEMSR